MQEAFSQPNLGAFFAPQKTGLSGGSAACAAAPRPSNPLRKGTPSGGRNPHGVLQRKTLKELPQRGNSSKSRSTLVTDYTGFELIYFLSRSTIANILGFAK
jgi:hypothetical protein